VVIGGGLLGLEAAKGLMSHNLDVTVVEMAPYLMSVQLDAAGGAVLGQTIERLGIHVRTSTTTKEIVGHTHVTAVRFADGTEIPADMVIIAAGIRPNIDLARECGLLCERAIVVDDQLCTSDPQIYAVGECVQHNGVVYGLVGPIWEQTRVLAQIPQWQQPPSPLYRLTHCHTLEGDGSGPGQSRPSSGCAIQRRNRAVQRTGPTGLLEGRDS
jgi:nitrite reductase (NADH) large subunit